MYSWEIDQLLKNNNYRVSSDTYLNICSTSPQINYVRYNAFGSYFEIHTDDMYYWKFFVNRKDV